MAMSADGKIATANRQLCSFGSSADSAFLYELRSRADAIMTGAATLRAQDADLTSGGAVYQRRRQRRGLAAEPVRVVVSSRGKLNPHLRIFREKGGPLVLLTTRQVRPQDQAALERAGASLGKFGTRSLDLAAALQWLARRWGVRHLHCEGGGELNQSLFESGWVDELYLTVCPRIFGGRQAPGIAEGEGFPSLSAAFRMELRTVRKIGDEIFLRFTRTSSQSYTRSSTAKSETGTVQKPKVVSSRRKRYPSRPKSRARNTDPSVSVTS